MIDFKDIAAAALSRAPGIVQTWLPGGTLSGHEYRIGNLHGDKGDSLSINCRTGKWADFAGDIQGGDLVSLYAAIKGITNGEAGKELASQFGLDTNPTPKAPAPDREAALKQPMTVGAPPKANFKHGKHGAPSGVWTYKAIDGRLIGYIARYDVAGKKEIVPYTHRGGMWVSKQFDEPRPLYNLPSLVEKPDANVLIVEGEKCADHAITLFPKLAVVTWPGGSKAIGKVDWEPLRGRKIAIWPDNDEPGFKAAAKIAKTLSAIGCDVRFILPPEEEPKGWDVADSLLKPETAMAWVRDRMSQTLPIVEEEPEPQNLIPAHYDDAPPMDGYPVLSHGSDRVEVESPTYLLESAPFRCLGHDRGQYFYFAGGTQQITLLSSSAHTKANLLQLAPLNYWKAEFRKGKTGEIDIDEAADCMMRACERVGIFNIDRIRGRGAWLDQGHVAIHLGDRVVYDGESLPPNKMKSHYIYEASQAMGGDISKPLNNREANMFIGLMELLPWVNPMSAKLAAGWCVVSHIGGVTHWRPHIWVIGARGSGKTWVMSSIFKPILGQNCLFVQSNSSEAGIRQMLGFDSLPVLFDEAEGETYEAVANLQRVLQLIRQSSSETGGRIAKGTPGGKAQRYMIRSCFALSSVNASIIQQSDKSRISILELSPDHRRYEFDEIQAAQSNLLNDKYIAGFYARAIKLAPIIKDNAKVFADAAASVLGEQRAGDQIGTLLAGAYSLYSDKIISFEKAVEWINQQDWTEKRDEIRGESDELALWHRLMTQTIQVKQDGATNIRSEMPIGALVEIANGEKINDYVSVITANTHLNHVGFRVADGGVYVSNTSSHIAKMLKDTPWSVGWGRILKRLPNARSVGMTYFGYKGSESRSTFVPL